MKMELPSSVEELLGFNPPPTIPLSEDVTIPFLEKIKGKKFSSDDAVFVSRYGNKNYEDHPLQWLEFSNDGSELRSYCPGPDDSDASVAGPFVLKNVDEENNNYVIELAFGCKTTFLLKQSAVTDTKENFVPMLITCQRADCLQRHRSLKRTNFFDVDELDGRRVAGDPGVVVLRRCTKCRQVHYCSIECQRKDWKKLHREECKMYGKMFPSGPDVDIVSANDVDSLVAVLLFIFKSCITGGEEREWKPENKAKAQAIGRRLYHLGGIDLCRLVCDDLREHFKSDHKRRYDAKTLNIVWADPVVPGWRP